MLQELYFLGVILIEKIEKKDKTALDIIAMMLMSMGLLVKSHSMTFIRMALMLGDI